ncbi:MAG: hypothetical protein ACKPKF_00435 [Microcystis panniformis]
MLAFVGRFCDNIFKRFYSQWKSVGLKKFCTDFHYKKSIAQVAGKVKSFPINYGLAEKVGAIAGLDTRFLSHQLENLAAAWLNRPPNPLSRLYFTFIQPTLPKSLLKVEIKGCFKLMLYCDR